MHARNQASLPRCQSCCICMFVRCSTPMMPAHATSQMPCLQVYYVAPNPLQGTEPALATTPKPNRHPYTCLCIISLPQAYRALARVLHPDKGGSSEAFGALQTAFEVLSNPKTRAVYDALAADVRFRPGAAAPYSQVRAAGFAALCSCCRSPAAGCNVWPTRRFSDEVSALQYIILSVGAEWPCLPAIKLPLSKMRACC